MFEFFVIKGPWMKICQHYAQPTYVHRGFFGNKLVLPKLQIKESFLFLAVISEQAQTGAIFRSQVHHFGLLSTRLRVPSPATPTPNRLGWLLGLFSPDGLSESRAEVSPSTGSGPTAAAAGLAVGRRIRVLSEWREWDTGRHRLGVFLSLGGGRRRAAGLRSRPEPVSPSITGSEGGWMGRTL